MNPKMKKISILTIPAVMVLIAVMVLTSCSGAGVLGKLGNNGADSAEEGIEIFELETGDIIQLVATTGFVDSSTLNYFNLQVSGEIISTVKKGDSFKTGISVRVGYQEAPRRPLSAPLRPFECGNPRTFARSSAAWGGETVNMRAPGGAAARSSATGGGQAGASGWWRW